MREMIHAKKSQVCTIPIILYESRKRARVYRSALTDGNIHHHVSKRQLALFFVFESLHKIANKLCGEYTVRENNFIRGTETNYEYH